MRYIDRDEVLYAVAHNVYICDLPEIDEYDKGLDDLLKQVEEVKAMFENGAKMDEVEE